MKLCIVIKKPLWVTLTTSLGHRNGSLTTNKSEVSTQWNNKRLSVIKADFHESVARCVCEFTTGAPVSTATSAGSSGITRGHTQAPQPALRLSAHRAPGMQGFSIPITLPWSCLFSRLPPCPPRHPLRTRPHADSEGSSFCETTKGKPAPGIALRSISQRVMLLPLHTSPDPYSSSSVSAETGLFF